MAQNGQTRGEPDDEVARAIMEHKQAARKQAYARRRAHAQSRAQAGKRCAALLGASALLGGVSTAACYVSMGTEISTMPLLALFVQRGVRTLVPRLGSGAQIGWTAVGANDLHTLRHAEKPAHGTLRPDEPRGPVLQASALGACDVIVLPALRVDRHGARLGRGGGWYDHALAWRRAGVPLVAVCWPWEFADEPVPALAHDVPVSAVLMPERLEVL
ncbi:5-formyltetrahydrofolate cyclo-ligase [Bifidobacterium pseudolongum subsp. globosum]|uniref:5-formyltetrahydrofolate cyclo-ligase n=1 Tax=Bifidobacterium pseudolongum subsp. globosum TaxID=1690 RepID=A0A2N3QFI3_9BIFI|nr:5-formyltetrahydrofolate cyclo-ligase [Bifidobacterium pseudolongum]PKU89442.1 5-formyltetrahydrofolate cyclo-ligase [Bifidobacterium pseudolongum subsp. globosum]